MIEAYAVIVIVILMIMLALSFGDKIQLSTNYGMLIGNFIVAVITVAVASEQESMGAGDDIALYFLAFIHIAGIVGVLAVSVVRAVKKNIGVHGIALVAGLIGTIVIGLSAVFIPLVVERTQVNNTRRSYIDDVESYLTTKYGEGNFKVTSSRNYYDDDKFSRYLSSYIYDVSTDYMGRSFIVSVDPGGTIEYDTFIPNYYVEKYNLRDWYNEGFDEYIEGLLIEKYPDARIPSYKIGDRIYGSDSEVCPDCGRIPTIDELIEILYNY